MISLFGKSTLGLAYSIFITDTLIAPGFPSNTARGGVLFPVILALAQNRGSTPDDENLRRLGGYLMFCGMASLAITSALWFTATSGNPVGAALAAEHGMSIDFGSWLLASSVPCLVVIALLPAAALSSFSAGNHRHSGGSRHRPKRAADDGADVAQRVDHGGDLRVMVTGWILAAPYKLNLTAIALAGLATLMISGVLTLEDINKQGGTLVTFIWLAVLFGMSGQLNEMGFMGYVGERLAVGLEGLAWPVAYVALLVIYVLLHFGFVSQNAQVLALLGVFLDVGVKSGVPVPFDGLRAAVCQQLLLGHYATRRQPEHHLRRQRLSQAERTVPPGDADDNRLLHPGVSGHRHPLDTLGRLVRTDRAEALPRSPRVARSSSPHSRRQRTASTSGDKS
ncbi:MAG: anion permease [Candidatus Accumulibacter delftensis]